MNAWMLTLLVIVSAGDSDGDPSRDAEAVSESRQELTDNEWEAMEATGSLSALRDQRSWGRAHSAPPEDGLAFGLWLRERQQLADAARVLEATAIAQGDDPWLWVELAVTRSWMGDTAGASDAYDLALEIDPTNVVARNGHARMSAWEGDNRRAYQGFSHVLGLDPGNLEAMLGLGFVERSRDRGPRARSWYSRALEVNPDNVEAISAIEALGRGSRLTTSVSAGVLSNDGGETAVGGVSASLDAPRYWSLSAGYGAATTTNVWSGSPSATVSHRVRFGVQRSLLSLRSGWGLTIEHRLDDDLRVSTNWETGFPLSDRLTMSVTARPRWVSDTGFDVLGSFGGGYRLTDSTELRARVYGFGSPDTAVVSAAVGTSIRFSEALRGDLTASRTIVADVESSALSAGVHLRLGSVHTLSARYERIIAPFTQHSAQLALSRAW